MHVSFHKRALTRAVLAVGMGVVSAGSVLAADVNWTGGGLSDKDWATPVNWSSNPLLPGTSDQARVRNNTQSTAAQLTTPQTVNQLRVGLEGDAGYLNVTSDLTITDGNESNAIRVGDGATGKITQTAGAFYSSGGFFVGSGNASGNGTYALSGGTLSSNYMFIGRGGSSTGVVTQTGGTVTLRDGGDALRIGAAGGASGTYGISAGSLSASRIQIGGEGDSTTLGTLIVGGSASVHAGNAIGIGKVGSGILRIDGSKTGSGTDVTIGDRLTWSSGQGIGTLNALIDAAAISDPTAMRKVSAGALTINPGSLLSVDFAAGTTPTSGTWTILTWGGFNSAEAANLKFASGVSSNWTYNLDTSSKLLTVTYSVPEPAMLGVLGVSLTLLAARRRVRA